MKCISLIGFSMLVIMAGCSKQTERQPWQADNSDAWKYDESLPVPVQFAPQGISITTRGIIENDSDLEGKPIGIFGLSVWHQDTGIVPGWNPDDPSTVLFADEPVTIKNGNVKFNTTYYYPVDNGRTFSFYAYHPYDVGNPAQLQAADDGSRNNWYVEYTAERDDLGNIDILYAKADAESVDGLNGFNADYLRANPDKQPELHFEHKVAALEFRAVLSDDYQAGSGAEDVTISKVTLRDVPTEVWLWIASRNKDMAIGKVSAMRRGPISLKNNEGSTDFSVKPAAGEGNLIGTFLLVPRPYNAGNPDDSWNYSAYVTAEVPNGEPEEVFVEFQAPKGGFQPGCRYTINIVVNKLEGVGMSTRVDSYTDSRQPPIEAY